MKFAPLYTDVPRPAATRNIPRTGDRLRCSRTPPATIAGPIANTSSSRMACAFLTIVVQVVVVVQVVQVHVLQVVVVQVVVVVRF